MILPGFAFVTYDTYKDARDLNDRKPFAYVSVSFHERGCAGFPNNNAA